MVFLNGKFVREVLPLTATISITGYSVSTPASQALSTHRANHNFQAQKNRQKPVFNFLLKPKLLDFSFFEDHVLTNHWVVLFDSIFLAWYAYFYLWCRNNQYR